MVSLVLDEGVNSSPLVAGGKAEDFIIDLDAGRTAKGTACIHSCDPCEAESEEGTEERAGTVTAGSA